MFRGHVKVKSRLILIFVAGGPLFKTVPQNSKETHDLSGQCDCSFACVIFVQGASPLNL